MGCNRLQKIIQPSHLPSLSSLLLSMSNHFQLLLCCQLQLIPFSILLPISPSVTILRAPPVTLWLKTLLTTLHLISVFSLKTCLWISLPALISMIHQLISHLHLPSYQKSALHWPQNLISHFSLYLRQQSKLACLTFFQKYHLRSSIQSGERGSEKMKRKTKKSM